MPTSSGTCSAAQPSTTEGTVAGQRLPGRVGRPAARDRAMTAPQDMHSPKNAGCCRGLGEATPRLIGDDSCRTWQARGPGSCARARRPWSVGATGSGTGRARQTRTTDRRADRWQSRVSDVVRELRHARVLAARAVERPCLEKWPRRSMPGYVRRASAADDLAAGASLATEGGLPVGRGDAGKPLPRSRRLRGRTERRHIPALRRARGSRRLKLAGPLVKGRGLDELPVERRHHRAAASSTPPRPNSLFAPTARGYCGATYVGTVKHPR